MPNFRLLSLPFLELFTAKVQNYLNFQEPKVAWFLPIFIVDKIVLYFSRVLKKYAEFQAFDIVISLAFQNWYVQINLNFQEPKFAWFLPNFIDKIGLYRIQWFKKNMPFQAFVIAISLVVTY